MGRQSSYIQIRRNRHYSVNGDFKMPMIQKSLGWLDRYIVALHKAKIVDVNLIYAIRAFKLPITKRERTLAQCTRLGNNKNYVITLRLETHKQEETKVQLKTTAKTVIKNIGHKKIPIREILEDMAHEIAHVCVWDENHSVNHEIVTTTIYLLFLKQLKKDLKKGLFTEKQV